jgi:cytochrome c-type biogenesis protein CcmF
MMAETGLAALWLAAALAALQFVLMIIALRSGADVRRAMRSIAIAQGLLTLLAFAMLLTVFALSDMSVALVFENSASNKPLIYKIAGAWGNHEGSMLMWVTILAVAGAFVAVLAHRTSERTTVAALGAQAVLALGFYGFLLIASNPFARLWPSPPDGQGLNPLLQDPGLAFHPPTLYLGYVGLSVAFSFAVGALLTGEVDSRLARAMRPWVLGAWILLTLGITAGSYWAYYELGWGGYWFWDPVENASLMPWLAATALLHSINVLAARGALKAWTMMLSVIAFSMSMVGTFLVRSGILTSVHAFAIDPQRGTFLLALLAIYVGAAFTLFAIRAPALKEGAPFELVSRETGLVINNLILSVILGIVFVGTLYPLFVEAVSGEKISVGAPYFNAVAGPLALLLAVLVGIGPLLAWRRERRPVLKRLQVPALLGITVLAITIILWRDMHILPRLGFTVAAYLAAASIVPMIGRNPLRAPLATWGMVVAHFGIAVALVGMAANAAFSTQTLAVAQPGEILTVGPWAVQLAGVTPIAGKDWTAIQAELRASDGSRSVTLDPASRYYPDPPTETSESAIRTFWNGQLYTVVGKQDPSGGWQLRLWWKPFVTLIWAGGALIAIGGALALLGRLWPLIWRRRSRREDWRQERYT